MYAIPIKRSLRSATATELIAHKFTLSTRPSRAHRCVTDTPTSNGAPGYWPGGRLPRHFSAGLINKTNVLCPTLLGEPQVSGPARRRFVVVSWVWHETPTALRRGEIDISAAILTSPVQQKGSHRLTSLTCVHRCCSRRWYYTI